MTDQAAPKITFGPVTAADFEPLLALRIAVMRAHLERVGRFSPERARQRFGESFHPDHMRMVHLDGVRVGCVSLRPSGDGLELENFYLDAATQGRGIGAAVLRRLLDEADAAGKPVRLTVLKHSRAHRLYERHGFHLVGEAGVDLFYERPVPASGQRSTSASSLP